MRQITHGIDLATMKLVRIRKNPKKKKKKRIWMYQWPGEKPQELIKEGRWWYYNNSMKASNISGEVGCDTLAGAKGDLVYSGAKVWVELIPNN